MPEILRRISDFAQNSAHHSEGIYKSEIHRLDEELLFHRARNRHLDETLKTTVIELDNQKQKSRESERQFEQCQKESMDRLTKNLHLNETMKTTVIELDDEKQKRREFEKHFEQCKTESMVHLKQKDALRKELDDALRLIDESKKKFEVLPMKKG